MMEPIIVSSENGATAAQEAMVLLRQGASALDAAVAAATYVERDLADRSVGVAGIPNVRGEVELDASVMDGQTLRAGGVAALRAYADAAWLARYVMERTPHVLVVGEGARRLAREAGCEPVTLEHEDSLAFWRRRFTQAGLNPEALDEGKLLPPVRTLTGQLSLSDAAQGTVEAPETGTVNFLVRDGNGRLASVVSTSGLGWKYPGRVGDSPIIGAGNYCDDRFGAAACTGMGELCLRLLTARSVVDGLRRGLPLEEAGREALADLARLEREEGQFIGFVTLTPAGRHMGFSEKPGREYAYMTGAMAEARLAPRTTLADMASTKAG